MKNWICVALLALLLPACKSKKESAIEPIAPDTVLARLFEEYYKERMQLFPLEATENGVNDYNDKLHAEFTDSFRAVLKEFYSRRLSELQKIGRDGLNETDQVNYDILKWELEMGTGILEHPYYYLPIDQFWGLHLKMGQFGSGQGAQPFKTIKDYDNWLSRLKGFDAWADSAIVYMKRGMASGVVLPRSLVVKVIPQLEAMVTKTAEENLYFSPVNLMPDSFSAGEKQRLKSAYADAVKKYVISTHKRLAEFLKGDYMAQARSTSGIGSLPGGPEYYRYLVRFWTTSGLTPDSIYSIGLSEVKWIREEMERVKTETGYSGTLSEFFKYLYEDSAFFPYKKPEEVLSAFRSIEKTIEPVVKKMFTTFPKTPFEIRRTEAFREASGSAEYVTSPDGIKPGIFYVPIPDARKFNTAGMEALFLHEAIPGHHFQISLQQENESLPEFRKHAWSYGPYVEGWALYCETLGKELGLYTDPYQYFTALGEQMLRAVRLVMDVGIHYKGMTREEAIQYMIDNYPTTMDYAVSETERYMAIPGQALGYRIGVIRIKAMRDQYKKQLGDKFSLSAFHDEFLRNGSMPIGLLEERMQAWAGRMQQ